MAKRIISGPFMGLKKNHYKVIVADPPWHFKARSDKGLGRSADMHYDTMSLEDIMGLPVQDLAAKDCVLFLWITDPMLFKGQELMERWGFKYKTVGFYWVKLNKDGETPFTGMGFWTRANPEQVLTNLDEHQVMLGAQGHPKRQAANIPRLIMSKRREHSRKPDEMFDRVESLVDGPYLELFSREERKGWDTWGNETGKFSAPEEPFEDGNDLLGF